MPTMQQAGTYSATLQYLKAVQAAGTDNADAVNVKVKIDEAQRCLCFETAIFVAMVV